ncbi:hypothetical protein DXC41_10115 [Bacteroides stercoris]|jgi:hypothetical protein|nr:hypothetical protein DXD55_01035 [Bacteroides stercoris]RGL90634.1 hypothetical protein DXC41_10115 [Bacteroides stercoris]RGZ65837.1 hypothetical protein DW980_04940 [Bacteroides stercoris]
MYNVGKPDVKPRFPVAGSPVAGCGPYGFHMRAVQPAVAGRGKRCGIAGFCIGYFSFIHKGCRGKTPAYGMFRAGDWDGFPPVAHRNSCFNFEQFGMPVVFLRDNLHIFVREI